MQVCSGFFRGTGRLAQSVLGLAVAWAKLGTPLSRRWRRESYVVPSLISRKNCQSRSVTRQAHSTPFATDVKMSTILDMTDPCCQTGALGEHALWANAVHFIWRQLGHDIAVVPQWQYPEIVRYWEVVLGRDRILREIPPDTESVKRFRWIPERYHPRVAKSLLQIAVEEFGYEFPPGARIEPPLRWLHDPDSDAVLLYPVSHTIRYRTPDYWLTVARALRERGWAINLVGAPPANTERYYANRPEAVDMIERLTPEARQVFPATTAGLQAACGLSRLSIGGSNGPGWALWISDIPQIIIERGDAWEDMRSCAPQVAKPLAIYGVDDLEWLNTLPNAKLDFPVPPSPIAQRPIAVISDSRTYRLWRQNPARR